LQPVGVRGGLLAASADTLHVRPALQEGWALLRFMSPMGRPPPAPSGRRERWCSLARELPAGGAEIPIIAIGSTGAVGRLRRFDTYFLISTGTGLWLCLGSPSGRDDREYNHA